jgi:hypothetical protein
LQIIAFVTELLLIEINVTEEHLKSGLGEQNSWKNGGLGAFFLYKV